MADEKIRIDIEAKDDASKVIDKVADGAEALEKMNPEVEISADSSEAIGDIEKTEAAAKELASQDVEIILQAKVDDMRQALNKAEGDLNQFKDKARTAGDATKNLGDNADQSRSVLANMAGNSAQDLGELGGVAGTAGVAIGQLAEYAADGNIALNKMATTVPALIAVMAVIKGIQGVFADMAEDKTFKKERVEGFTEALKDGADAAEAMEETLREAGKIELRLLGDTADITPALNNLGVSIEDFTRLATGSEEDLLAWGEAMKGAGADGDQVAIAMAAAAQSGDQMSEAQENAATSAEFLGESEEEAAKKTEEATKRMDEQREAANELVDAHRAAADSAFGLRDAQADYADATANTIAVQKDAEHTAEDLEDAYRNEREAAINAADAAVRYAEDQAKASGKTVTATDRLDALNSSLLTSARTATPAARDQIIQYIAEVNGIPLSKATAIVANADTKKAEDDLKYVTRARTVVVRPTLDQAAAIWMGKELYGPGSPGGARRSVATEEAPAAAFYSNGAPSVTNVVMNVPNGVTPRGVVAEMENFVRRNGGTVRR